MFLVFPAKRFFFGEANKGFITNKKKGRNAGMFEKFNDRVRTRARQLAQAPVRGEESRVLL